MKAIVCRTLTGIDDLRYETVDSPQPGADEVKVSVRGAGVNFPDVLKVRGQYQVLPDLPWIPGGEVAGVVTAVGDRVDTVRPGDRVLGVSDAKAGGFAQEIVLAQHRVLPLHTDITFIEAAALPVVYGTTLYALRQRAQLQPAETLLVLGAAGGVGLAAVQMGRAMGARVIAAASTADKRKLAAEHGADSTVDYSTPDWRDAVMDMTEGVGVDVVFDPVGGDVFDQGVRCVGWMGRYLIVGFASGRIPSIKVNHPLLKNYDLLGVRYDVWRDRCWDQAHVNLKQVLQWQEEGQIRPHISATYDLENAAQALHELADRKVSGKIVLIPE